MADVDMIALDGGYVLMSDEKVLPITRMLDIDGSETTDPDAAVVCVAGEDGYGWLRIEIFPGSDDSVGVH
jgi:hypothetical protein